jgi:hypothetical protein
VTQDFGDEGFGDFDPEDTADDLGYTEVDWEAVQRLQNRYDAIAVLPTAHERKIATKALIRELNGEDSGPVLVT